jgi:glycosyltransferase involved in cell wall biosynthesis
VVCLKRRGVLADQVEAGGVRVVSLGCEGRGLRTTLARAVRCLRALRPDVLHTHNPHPHLVGSVAAALLGLPAVVNTKHGRNDPDRRAAVLLNRFAALLSRTVVAVSDDAARVATAVERVPRRKVRLIRNGIDLAPFPPPDPAARRGPVRAIHVARLNLIKDQTTLLEAVRLMADRVPDFRLTVVGDGPRREDLLADRDRLGLRDRVDFLGERADVPALLAQADLFVLSSLQEGLSLTLLEAMAAGLAVVATDVGGNREVVVPGETGLLVPSRSPDRLAEAILACVRDPAATREMGRRGRSRVEREFGLDATVQQYENLYESVVSRRHQQ